MEIIDLPDKLKPFVTEVTLEGSFGFEYPHSYRIIECLGFNCGYYRYLAIEQYGEFNA